MGVIIRCDRCKAEGADQDMLGLKGFVGGGWKTSDLCKKCQKEFRCVLANTDDFTATLSEIMDVSGDLNVDCDSALTKIYQICERALEGRRG